MRHWVAMMAIAAGTPALAGAPAAVPAATFRLKPVRVVVDPTFRVDDPRSHLATGFGGALVELFPATGSKFHVAAGPRLFGRPGRPHLLTPASQALLPAIRAPGWRAARRMTPALLVGYGAPAEQGLSLGIDAGVIKGRTMQGPDRLGRFDPARIDTDVGRGRTSPLNELVRMTALYRF